MTSVFTLENVIEPVNGAIYVAIAAIIVGAIVNFATIILSSRENRRNMKMMIFFEKETESISELNLLYYNIVKLLKETLHTYKGISEKNYSNVSDLEKQIEEIESNNREISNHMVRINEIAIKNNPFLSEKMKETYDEMGKDIVYVFDKFTAILSEVSNKMNNVCMYVDTHLKNMSDQELLKKLKECYVADKEKIDKLEEIIDKGYTTLLETTKEYVISSRKKD